MTKKKSSNFLWLLCCTLILSNSEGFTQQSARPEPPAAPAAIIAPRDIPYAGTIRLTVDATDIDRHIFIVRESIPVRGGDSLVLFYPQWLPGNHSPTGRIDKLPGAYVWAESDWSIINEIPPCPARWTWTWSPLDDLNRGGYKLVYKETPSEY